MKIDGEKMPKSSDTHQGISLALGQSFIHT